MTQPGQELPDVERQALLTQRKRQVWQVVLVMSITSCVGSAILIYLLWLLFQRITP